MQPTQFTPDVNTMGKLISIDGSLSRIAHALEALAKHADPQYKTMRETAVAQSEARRQDR